MEIFITVNEMPWTSEKVSSQNLQYINKYFPSQKYVQCMNKYSFSEIKVITWK